MRTAITVRELIDVLSAFNPDMPVQTEGCDCIGPCSGANVQSVFRRGKHQDAVVLCRDDLADQEDDNG